MRRLPTLLLSVFSLGALLGCGDDIRARTAAAIEAQTQPTDPRRPSLAPSARRVAVQAAPPSGGRLRERARAEEPAPRQAAGSGLESATSPGPAPGPAHAASPLRLRAQARTEGEGSRLEWTLENVGPAPVYVFAVLPGWGGSGEVPDFEAVYVRRRGETLHLTRRLWRIPSDLKVFRPQVPYLVRLEPGQIQQGGFWLPRQVASRFPYAFGSAPGGQTAQVVLSFGYLDPAEGLAPRPADLPGLFRIDYARGIAAQRSVESEALPLALEVLP